jgi:hypothetical protein
VGSIHPLNDDDPFSYDDDSYHDDLPTGWVSRRKVYILLLVLLPLIGFTVAANVSLNGNSKVEFGQGLYKITSCDQFVSIYLGPSTTYGDGYSRVANIQIQGLDVARCANTSLRIKLYDGVNPSPMNLFTNPQYTKSFVTYPCCTETGTAVTMVIAAGATQSTALASTSLVSPSGKNVGTGDRSESLSYDPSLGVFTIAFPVPLASMQYVSTTTLESASNV